MDTAALDLKKYIPRLATAIERPQLLDSLRSALGHKLILISAPPGYGKTTIASQLASQAQFPAIWHTVEERERDFPNLYYHCLSTFEPLVNGIGSNLPSPENIPPSELAMLVGDYLHRAQTSDFIYVLDDVHFLDGTPSSESWLQTLLARLPRSCHIVLVSRTLPNLPYAEMVSRRDIFAIGPEDLRFTEDEIDRLAQEFFEGAPRASQMHVLASLNGWPAGVFLALQPHPTELIDAMFGGSFEPQTVFEALARPMLFEQSPELQGFLLGSSTLRYLTPELCEKVLRLSNGAEWLKVAQTRNLFISRVSAGLEYHALFRDFLQRELRSANPGRFAELHLKAARWFEDIDDIEQAVEHYLAAGRPEQAQKLVEKTAVDYRGQGRFETLMKWSATLNKVGVLAPNLSFECSVIHVGLYEYGDAARELEQAEQGFSIARDARGLARVKLQRALMFRQQGKYREAIKLAEEVINLRIDSLRGQALRVIGSSSLRLGNTDTAISYLEEAVKLYREVGMAAYLSQLLQDLQFAYMRVGRLDEMGNCLQEVIALRRKLGGRGALALALNALGYYYHKRGNYQEALSTLEEGLRIVAGVPDRRSESYLLYSLGDLKRDLGYYQEAQSHYDRALQLVPPNAEPNLYSAILINLSTMRRWQGRADEAIKLAVEARKIAMSRQIAFEAAMAEAVLWLARGQVDDPCQALKHLRGVVEDLHNQGAYFEMLEVLGGCIHVAELCEDQAVANDYLTVVLWLATEMQTAQSLIAEIDRQPSIETRIAECPESTQLLAELKKLREAQNRLGKHVNVISTLSPTDTYSLRVLTLGQANVERDGKAVSIAEWQAAAPRELFFFLLFNGPKNRGETEAVFWPESTPDRAQGLFHTALYCARQALGSNVILFENELYFANPDLRIETDAYQLESWTTQARLLSPSDARTEDLWRKAVEIYKGDFLRSLDAQWVVARRVAYSGMYRNALVGLAHCARARNDLDTAIEWFSAAIAVDPYSEDIYRQIMHCHAKLGEMGKIRTWFYELKRVLNDDLGIEPSAETTTMIRNILGNI